MSNVIPFPARKSQPEDFGYQVLPRGDPDWAAIYRDELQAERELRGYPLWWRILDWIEHLATPRSG